LGFYFFVVFKVGQEMYLIYDRLRSILPNGMRVYREIWKTVHGPAVPYCGIFLTDLTYLEDGNPTYRGKAINFEKFQKIHHTIHSILKSQNHPYDVQVNPNVYGFFQCLPVPSDKDYQLDYDRSVELEPNDQIQHIPKFQGAPEDSLRESITKLLALRNHALVCNDYSSTGTYSRAAFQKDFKQLFDFPDDQPSSDVDSDMSLICSKFSPIDLEDISGQMRTTLPKGDHRWRMTVYHDSFTGSETVDWLMTNVRKLESRQEAVSLGQLLVSRHYLRHVTSHFPFRDKGYLYVFVNKKIDI
jgi:hypothetical protein